MSSVLDDDLGLILDLLRVTILRLIYSGSIFTLNYVGTLASITFISICRLHTISCIDLLFNYPC